MRIKIESGIGEHIGKTLQIAQEKAITSGQEVQFDFNGVRIVVDKQSNLDHIYRDYCNAHLMKWEEVGPHTEQEYSASVVSEMDRRRNEIEIKHKKNRERHEREKQEKDRALQEKVKGIKYEVSDEDTLRKWEESNTSEYGKAVINYALLWGRLMQAEMSSGAKLKEVAEKCSRDADIEGITGFMYGCAVNVLATTWKHGEELRKWHNKKYNHDGEGVVNPAVITIK